VTADHDRAETVPLSWRELAVSRSLDPARARAESRVQRYLDAAVELLNGERGKDFTVQEVVERSGQSLRGFYQYFAGKHELLLALFEESIYATTERLRTVVAAGTDPLDRLRRFVAEYQRLCRATREHAPEPVVAAPAVAEFAHQLMTDHPREASAAFLPLVSLLVELLDDAERAGAIHTTVEHRWLAGVLLQTVMFNSLAPTISGPAGPEDEGAALWDLLFLGLSDRRAT
jgi:AcrR family transcriptional regulator